MPFRSICVNHLRLLLAIVLLSILGSGCGGNGDDQTAAEQANLRYVTASSGLVLRSNPDRNAERLTAIPAGHAVQLIEEKPEEVNINGTTGHWCYVRFGEQQGWVFGAYLTAQAPAVPVGRANVECYRFQSDTTTATLRLETTGSQVRGEVEAVIQDAANSYFSSYSQHFTGQRDGQDLRVEIVTEIEDDIQNANQVWHLEGQELTADGNRFRKVQCQGQ